MLTTINSILDDVYGKNADEVGNENQKQKLLCSLLFVDVDIIEREGDFFLPASLRQLFLIVTFQTVSVAGPGSN